MGGTVYVFDNGLLRQAASPLRDFKEGFDRNDIAEVRTTTRVTLIPGDGLLGFHRLAIMGLASGRECSRSSLHGSYCRLQRRDIRL